MREKLGVIRLVLPVLAVWCLAAVAAPATAAPVDCKSTGCTVSDGGASMGTSSGEQHLEDVIVNGVDHMAGEEFHLTFDGDPVADEDISAVLTLDSATEDEDTNTIVTVFKDNGHDVTITITRALTGGPNSATVDETVEVENTATFDTISLSLVDKIDWDLADSSDNDVAVFVDPDTFYVTDGGPAVATSTSLSSFDYFDVAPCCEDDIFALNRVDGHLGEHRGPLGPEDIEVGFQYDITFAPDDVVTFRERHEVRLVSRAAPAASGFGLALLALGLLGFGAARLLHRQQA